MWRNVAGATSAIWAATFVKGSPAFESFIRERRSLLGLERAFVDRYWNTLTFIKHARICHCSCCMTMWWQWGSEVIGCRALVDRGLIFPNRPSFHPHTTPRVLLHRVLVYTHATLFAALLNSFHLYSPRTLFMITSPRPKMKHARLLICSYQLGNNKIRS